MDTSISHSVADTKSFAMKVLESLRQQSTAGVLALYGDLGSGKTTFVQEFGKLLGIQTRMQSPTFVIMKMYDISYKTYTRFIHIDAYRLEKPEELDVLGWTELLKDPKNLIVIEWAERAGTLLPSDSLAIRFTFVDDTTRKIEVLQ